MNILELRMNYSAFIRLRDFVKINDLSAEIKEYSQKNDVLEGKLDVSGSYLKNDMEKIVKFNEEIPFTIMFKDSDFDVIDIDCVNLDYHIIDGRGLEIEFDIQVKYEDLTESTEIAQEDEFDEENDVVEIPVIIPEETVEVEKDICEEVVNVLSLKDNERELITEEVEIQDITNDILEDLSKGDDEYEKVKDEKTQNVDQLIANKLSFVDDNLPSEVSLDNEIPEKRTKIRVCYYDADSDLERVCEEKAIGIDKVFKDNKDTDFTKFRRIIIK